MIIQVRGTSGSGKTTVVRKVMERMGDWEPFYKEGRRKPLGYTWPGCMVLGHYEIDCGGCDTIGSAPKVYDTIIELKPKIHVLSEGLLWSEDVKWSLALTEQGYEVRALFLATEPEECLRRVTIRQKGRKPIDPARVRRKLMTRVETIDRARARLVNSGIYCRRLSLEQSIKRILSWLQKG